MAQVSPDGLLKALARMGFWGRSGGSHMVLVYVMNGRKTRIRTVVDRHGRPYGDGRISEYARQLGLEKDEFDQFLDGSMSPEQYRDLVMARGRI